MALNQDTHTLTTQTYHRWNLLVDMILVLNSRLWFLAKSTGPVKKKSWSAYLVAQRNIISE